MTHVATEMSSPSAGSAPYHIVVGTDYSLLSERAIYAAFDIALQRPSAQLHVITVAEGIGPERPEEVTREARQRFHDEAEATLERYLEERLSGLDEAGAHIDRRRVNVAVDFGSPTERILALAEKVQADLIVIGTHGRKGLDLLLVGSVAEDVLRYAHCPVLVVRGKHHETRDT